jgi:dUTP pyrophosphatase
MKIRIKKLSEDAVIPQYSKQGDAGLDLTAISRRTDPKGFIEFDTHIAVEIPAGFVGLVFPRSSISKVNMSLTNAVGVIDSGYRGSIKFRFKPSTSGKGIYELGDRIGQLIIMPYPEITFVEVDELDDTERGDSGFGSTDTWIDESGHVHKG